MDYTDFIRTKSQIDGNHGFEPLWLPDCLFPFQRHLAEWSIRKGRAAIFADCGMGKTLMQLTWAENVKRHTGKSVLILTPLAVSQQTEREAAKFGIDAKRSQDGKHNGGIVITNYERLHYFEPTDFAAVVCDEASILKNFTGQRRKQITRFTSKLSYRLLCTATPSPNDYIELGTLSECLGELSYSEMLKRFFKQLDDKGQKREQKLQDEAEKIIEADPQYYQKLAYRVSQTIGQWRLKHHAVTAFWRWVASWAKACRMPSDLGFSDEGFVLPPLHERDHIIKAKSLPPGMLFNVPAFGLQGEREERRRTLEDRCEFVAELVDHDRPAVVWCHMNAEGDLLEKIIPHSLQVAGHHSEDYRIIVSEWFAGHRCLCSEDLFYAKLATWQRKQSGLPDTGQSIIESIVLSALKRRSNMAETIPPRENSTCLSTTQTTKTSGQKRKSSKKSEGDGSESDTLTIQNTGLSASRKELRSGSESRKHESHGQCESTARLLKSINDLKSWDVLSAAAKTAATDAAIDFILTTTMTPANSEGYSVLSAILGSENLATIQSVLKKQLCICGHVSGRRKLVTKSKIFGHGMNWQFCSDVVSFATHSYESYFQSVRRCWRFGQKRPVKLDVIATEGELRVLGNMRRKAVKAEAMFAALIREMSEATRIEREDIYTGKVEHPSWL